MDYDERLLLIDLLLHNQHILEALRLNDSQRISPYIHSYQFWPYGLGYQISFLPMFSLILFYRHQLVLRIRNYQLDDLDFVILHENVRLHLPLFEQLHLVQSHVHVTYLLIEEVFLFLLRLILLQEYLLIDLQHEQFLHLLQLLVLIDYLLEHEVWLEPLILEFLFLI